MKVAVPVVVAAVRATLLVGLCAACGTATETSTTTGGGGARGTTSVGPVTGGSGSTGGSSSSTGGSSDTSSSGTSTGGATIFGTGGGSPGGSSSSTTGGTATAGAGTATAGAGTAGTASGGTSAGSTTGAPATYQLKVQVLGGAPGSVTVQNEAAQTLTFMSDGNQVFSRAYSANDIFTINPNALHAHRACTWTSDANQANQFGTSDVHVTVSCVWQAVRVLGQQDFTSKQQNQSVGAFPSANTMASPTGNPVIGGGNVLFIADASNHRVLGYTSVPSVSNESASFQIGQPDFTTGNSAPDTSLSGFHAPFGLASNGTRLAVADTDNNRVMLYTTQPQGTGNANFVLHGPQDCDGRGLYLATGVAWANDKLIVADTKSSRVLIYNTVPSDPNQQANVILGQTGPNTSQSGTSCTWSGNTTASTLYTPNSVFFDGTRLVVTDTGESRVMIWNALPTQTNQAANVILGQANAGGFSAGSGPAALSRPWGSIIAGGRLFVADSSNNRVLYWNSVPSSTGVAADGAFGQPSPASSSLLCADTPSASTLCNPTGIAVYGGYIFVVDTDNHRVLMFADDLN